MGSIRFTLALDNRFTCGLSCLLGQGDRSRSRKGNAHDRCVYYLNRSAWHEPFSLVPFVGGSTFFSPDGRYRLSTWSKLSDVPGGRYTVELFLGNSSRPIRSVSIRVASTERTPVMRGGCDARWDMAAGTVDLLVDGRPELRLYFEPGTDDADTRGG